MHYVLHAHEYHYRQEYVAMHDSYMLCPLVGMNVCISLNEIANSMHFTR